VFAVIAVLISRKPEGRREGLNDREKKRENFLCKSADSTHK